jgi:hypothetical protein
VPQVLLGNENVIESVKKDPGGDASPENLTVKKRKDLGNQITTVSLPDTHTVDTKHGAVTMWPFEEQLAAIRRFIEMHMDGSPAWVESTDGALQLVIAQQYGCPEGRPKTWKTGG